MDTDSKRLSQAEQPLIPPRKALTGQVALVTGGASGLGKATARRLGQEMADVAILDINSERLRETFAEMTSSAPSGRVLPIRCDVSSEADVKSAFAETWSAFGRLDIVVNNAGLYRGGLIEETTLEQWKTLFDVLATGYYLVAREAFRGWKGTRTSGRMVFITSKNAVVASPSASLYSALKAAEQHLARCLADEGGPFGIRVNCVMPDGVIRGTNIFTPQELEKSAARHGVKPEDIDEFYRTRNALKVNITPQDVAEAVFFLVSEQSGKITGAALTVDGGVTASYVR
jgi:NAD(P)-dependent dehydrogenase (short-subunit alcohol dehydrogenase family)